MNRNLTRLSRQENSIHTAFTKNGTDDHSFSIMLASP